MGIMPRETVPDLIVAYHYLMTPRIRSENECAHYFGQFIEMASRLEGESHIAAHAMTWGVYERILDYEDFCGLVNKTHQPEG